MIGATTGSVRAGCRGRAPPEGRLADIWPAAQSADTPPPDERQRQPEQSRFERNARHLLAVADILPPIGNEVADPARRQREILRQLRPSLEGINAGDRLQEVGRKILSANVLDGVDKIIDAQMGGVDRGPTCGKQAEMVVELGATERDLVGLLRLSSGRCRPEQIRLGLHRRETGLEMAPKILDPGTDALQLVAKLVELRIAQAWTTEIAFHAVEFALPTRNRRIDVDA